MFGIIGLLYSGISEIVNYGIFGNSGIVNYGIFGISYSENIILLLLKNSSLSFYLAVITFKSKN